MSKEDTVTLYVYGTLRPGRKDNEVLIPGTMYNLGWFPGVKLHDGPVLAETPHFVAEAVVVPVSSLGRIDRYEGHSDANPDLSFFRRVPYNDGFIYEYNRSVSNYPVILNGDFLLHIGRPAGTAASFLDYHPSLDKPEPEEEMAA